jgi:hypothetical protein
MFPEASGVALAAAGLSMPTEDGVGDCRGLLANMEGGGVLSEVLLSRSDENEDEEYEGAPLEDGLLGNRNPLPEEFPLGKRPDDDWLPP